MEAKEDTDQEKFSESTETKNEIEQFGDGGNDLQDTERSLVTVHSHSIVEVKMFNDRDGFNLKQT